MATDEFYGNNSAFFFFAGNCKNMGMLFLPGILVING